MATVDRDGQTIHYLDEGDGDPCLLIHGHTLDLRVWDEVSAKLCDAGRRVLRPDLRGHGRSSRPLRGYHWSDHAGDMLAVMEAAAVERATVAGFSIGGGVALEMTLAAPAAVSDLVLLSTVMPDRPFEPAFMDNLREVARTIRAQGVAAAMLGPWAASPLFTASMAKPGVRRRLEEIVLDFPGAEYLATERDRVERGWTVPQRLAEIAVPTRVAVGELEMAGFRAWADEASAGIRGATLAVFEGCGHLLPLEAPEQVAALILGTTT